MVLSDSVKKELEEYLTKWTKKLVTRKTKEYTSDDSVLFTKGKIKPFHQAMLSKDLIKSGDFERSFSTGLGSTFEECAKIIANTKFDTVEKQYKTENYIPTDTIAEVDKVMSELNEQKKFSNYQQEVKRIVDLAIKDTSNKISRSVISDLYVKDKNGNETYFEFKSPKPNKEQCLKVTQKHLLIHCMTKKHFPQVKTHYGMAYNPNGENNQYNHSFSKTFLDIKHHVMIGKNLWDYLGGDGTYEELLQIYKKVGKDTAMKLINEILKP